VRWAVPVPVATGGADTLATGGLLTTAASGDGKAARGWAAVRRVVPHILQKFIPAGLAVEQAGQASDEDASVGASGGLASAADTTGADFLAMIVFWLVPEALPPSTGDGSGGIADAGGMAEIAGKADADGVEAEEGMKGTLPPTAAAALAGGVALPIGGGAGAAMVFCGPFCGPGPGPTSGNRPDPTAGPTSGRRFPQFWQKVAPSRTERPHFGQMDGNAPDIQGHSKIFKRQSKDVQETCSGQSPGEVDAWG
jgi:hypothetical protein